MIQFYIRGYIWNEIIFLLFQFAPYASIQWYENSVQFFFLILYRRLDLMLKKDILSIIQVCVWFCIQFSGRYLMRCLTLNLKIIATCIHLISIVIFFFLQSLVGLLVTPLTIFIPLISLIYYIFKSMKAEKSLIFFISSF